MSGSSKYDGLCTTCNHAPDCAHRMRMSGPVLHCEEFDGYQAPPARSESPLPRTAGDYRPAAGCKYEGLCINCNFRETCINATSEKEVWYCENYR